MHSLASVVVIGESSMRVDAWATAFNVLGAVEGRAIAAKLDMPVMFIEVDGKDLRSITTPRFEPYLARQ